MAIGNRDINVFQTFEETAPAIANPYLVPVVIGQLKKFLWAEDMGVYSGNIVSLAFPDELPEGSVIEDIKIFFDPKIRPMIEIPAVSGETTRWEVSEDGTTVDFIADIPVTIEMVSKSATSGLTGASTLKFEDSKYVLEDSSVNFYAQGIYAHATAGDQITFTGLTGESDFVITEIISKNKVAIDIGAGTLYDWFTSRPDRVFEGHAYVINRVALVGSTLVPNVDVKVTLEAVRTDKTGQVHFIESASDLNELGPFYYKNDVGYGASLLYSYGGSRMAYVTVDEMTAESFADALALLEDEEVYFIIPLTNDRTLMDLCLGHVNTMSEPENMKERRLYGSLAIPDKVYRAFNKACVILADNVIEDETVNFFHLDVQIGDTVLINGEEDERIVLSIESETELKLSGVAMTPSDPGATEDYSVYSKLDTKDEQADYFRDLGASYTQRRANIIFPETLYRQTTEFDDEGNSETAVVLMNSYFANCAIVGQLRLQRGIGNPFSGMPVPGFEKLPERYFTDKQLRRIQSGGVLVCYPDEATKAPIVMQQLTTDVTSVLKQEITIQESADMFSKYIRVNMRPYMGNRNLSPKTIDATRMRLVALLENAASESGIDGRGPIIGAGSVLESYERDMECGDTMVARFKIEALVPFNKLNVYLYVSVAV